jgi:hypothetical protein
MFDDGIGINHLVCMVRVGDIPAVALQGMDFRAVWGSGNRENLA